VKHIARQGEKKEEKEVKNIGKRARKEKKQRDANLLFAIPYCCLPGCIHWRGYCRPTILLTYGNISINFSVLFPERFRSNGNTWSELTSSDSSPDTITGVLGVETQRLHAQLKLTYTAMWNLKHVPVPGDTVTIDHCLREEK